MTYALERLAELGATFAPTEADIAAACAALLDLATAVAAAPQQPFAAAVLESYGPGPCALWGRAERAAPAAAVFHNALAAARLDLDDGHRRARGHPGAAVIPAVLAEADRLDAAGRRATDEAILRAIIVGYEISLRIAAARGFYARTGFWAGFAAAAGAAALRDLPASHFAHALAIGGETGPHMATTTAGPAWPQPNGSDVKEGIAWGAMHGLTAVPLAAAGMTGALDLVDHAPFFDRAAILANRPRAAIHEIYTKFQAACRHCHAPVEALLTLMHERGLGAIEIEGVEVRVNSGALRIANAPSPRNLADAQYSIPYCLGLAAWHGATSLLPMTEAALDDAHATAFARKVRLTLDAACEARFPEETIAQVILIARGERYESRLTAPRGEASSPPSWAERLEKFDMATAPVLSLATRRTWMLALESLRESQLDPLRQLLQLRPGTAIVAGGR